MMNPKIDFYFNKPKKWQHALETLRNFAISCQLTEELKWGCPCYTVNNSNVVLIHDLRIIAHYYFLKVLC